jgi:cell division septation protein DedD
MARDYAKFVPPKSRTAKPKVWPVKLFVGIFFMAVALVAVSFYLLEKAHNDKKTFFAEVVSLLQHKPVVKAPVPVKVADQGPAPVHFDFYSELPNMQLPENEMENETPAALNGEGPVTTTVTTTTTTAKPVITPVTTIIPKSVAVKKPVLTKPSVFNATEVDELLADEKVVTQAQVQDYIIQLGVFETEPAAKRLIEAIASVGFQPRVVKLDRKGHNMYQVQQGPYQTMESARLEQLRLQKRGIISIIRKSV